MDGRIIMIDENSLKDLAKQMAKLMISELKETKRQEKEEYMDANQLGELITALKPSTIKAQIRTGKYGRKMGAKGKLVAKPSEVRRFNRLT